MKKEKDKKEKGSGLYLYHSPKRDHLAVPKLLQSPPLEKKDGKERKNSKEDGEKEKARRSPK